MKAHPWFAGVVWDRIYKEEPAFVPAFEVRLPASCVLLYIYIHMLLVCYFIYIHMLLVCYFIYAYIYIYVFIQICMYVCMSIYIRIYVCQDIHV